MSHHASSASFVPILIGLACLLRACTRRRPTRVFAAASLTDVLTDIGASWQKGGHPLPSLAFGASSALAKQIEAGAPADLFASADLSWMDYLATRGKIDAPTRVNLVGNELVLIAPKGRAFAVKMEKGFGIGRCVRRQALHGRAGRGARRKYAKEALESLGWWTALDKRIVGTDDVRTALAFVERGECAAGIVYATDAAVTDKVAGRGNISGRYAQAHRVSVRAHQWARAPKSSAFLDYLRSSPEAAAAFKERGFSLLRK